MIRLNLLAIGLVSIFALTGCNTNKAPSADSAGAAKDKATEAPSVAGAAKDQSVDTAGVAKDQVAGAAKGKVVGAPGAAKDKVASAAGAATDKLTGATPEVANLASIVSKTKTAIDAGNFEEAKAEISKFDDIWAKAEKGIEAKSPAAYQAISANVSAATGAVNSEDKPKAQAALTALGKALAMTAKP